MVIKKPERKMEKSRNEPSLRAKRSNPLNYTVPLQQGNGTITAFIYSHDYYLFSDDFKPGKSMKSEKQFRDYWLKLRDKLKFPASYDQLI
jgi:hypothetical protein